jgi:predicted nucleic acid-binding protein
MSYLLDTNIVSELRKGQKCDANVARWFQSVAEQDLFLSVLVVGEIRKGIELLRARDEPRASQFDEWLDTLVVQFGTRILPVDSAVGEEWGRLSAIRSLPVVDGLLAATARVYNLTFVTRDADVRDLDVPLLNPFV